VSPGFILTFVTAYLLPTGVTLIFTLIVILFVFWLSARRKLGEVKRALRAEIGINVEVSREALEYVRGQNVGDQYVNPMPRFHTAVFEALVGSGNLLRLGKAVLRRTDPHLWDGRQGPRSDARQEELAFGNSAGFPQASEVRAQNLAFIQDMVSNVILLRFDRLKERSV